MPKDSTLFYNSPDLRNRCVRECKSTYFLWKTFSQRKYLILLIEKPNTGLDPTPEENSFFQ